MKTTNSNFRSYLLCLLMVAALLTSCKKNDKNSNTEESFNLVKSTQDVVKKSQDLKKIDPVSFEEFKSWFPKTLEGMALKKIEKGSMTSYDISGASARYEGPGKTNLRVTINDGAGKNGTMLTSQYMMYKKIKPKTETDSKSTILLNDDTMLGVETHYKESKKVMLGFLYKDRFSVNIKSNNLEKQTVWNAFKELDIDKLF